VFKRLRREAEGELHSAFIEQIEHRPWIELRYRGQAYELRLEAGEPIWTEGLTRGGLRELEVRFHAEHRRFYSYALEEHPVEVVSLRLESLGRTPKPTLQLQEPEARRPPRPRARREVHFAGAGALSCPVFTRESLPPGAALAGPLSKSRSRVPGLDKPRTPSVYYARKQRSPRMTRRDLLKRFGALSIALALGSSLIRGAQRASASTDSESPWPMFRRDLAHTGFTEGRGRVRGPTLKWRFGTRGAVEPSAAVGDIDGDGKTEVVISAFDGGVYAVPGDGGGQSVIRTPKWSFQSGALIWSSPAIGDVDGDGQLEVVVGSDDKNVYVLDGATGAEKWRFPTLAKVRSSPTLADIDGDGQLEIVIGSNQIYALDARARRRKWAYTLQTTTFSSAAIGDIDGDGQLEIVIGSYDNIVYALQGRTGKLKWQFHAGNQVESSPALGDIDGDGQIEVVFGAGFIREGGPKGVYALRGRDGRQKWFYSIGVDQRVISSPALGDVDGDGRIEVVIGSNAGTLFVFDGQGRVKYTHQAEKFIESSPALGDIDGDGRIEIIVGSHDFKLYALRAVPGQPRLQVLWTFTPAQAANIFFSSPTLADIDGDGELELVVGNNSGELFAFDGV
jgi:outer membrane protein assembly factor BamB